MGCSAPQRMGGLCCVPIHAQSLLKQEGGTKVTGERERGREREREKEQDVISHQKIKRVMEMGALCLCESVCESVCMCGVVEVSHDLLAPPPVCCGVCLAR